MITNIEEVREYLTKEISKEERRMSERLSRMRERLEGVEELVKKKGWTTFTMIEFQGDDERKIEDGYKLLCQLREVLEMIKEQEGASPRKLVRESAENTKVEVKG